MADNTFARKAIVLARMKKIPAEVRTRVRAELDVQSAFLVEQIRPNIPRDHGDLAESLEWHRGDSLGRFKNIITEGAKDGTQGRKARAVEFGRPDMMAQPHFFPTYRAFRKKIKAALNRAGKKAVAIWGS